MYIFSFKSSQIGALIMQSSMYEYDFIDAPSQEYIIGIICGRNDEFVLSQSYAVWCTSE